MKQIPLTQGKFALVDDEDYEELSKFKWYSFKRGNTFYAIRNHPGQRLMHRMILNLNGKLVCDHKDRNGLNNQRSNLRICTQAQNCMNSSSQKNSTSSFLGVCWTKQRQKGKDYFYWRATISVSGKKIHLGSFKNEIEAARVYNEAAKKYFGEFANLNKLFP